MSLEWPLEGLITCLLVQILTFIFNSSVLFIHVVEWEESIVCERKRILAKSHNIRHDINSCTALQKRSGVIWRYSEFIIWSHKKICIVYVEVFRTATQDEDGGSKVLRNTGTYHNTTRCHTTEDLDLNDVNVMAHLCKKKKTQILQYNQAEVFWVVTRWSVVVGYWRVRDGGSMDLWNVGILP